MRLVDLDVVIDRIEAEWGYKGIREDLYNLPCVDVAPVVRCKDCRHSRYIPYYEEYACRGKTGGYHCADFGCTAGELQTNGAAE